MTPAIRTYLTDNKFNKVAFFCTCGGQKGKTFEEMEKLSKKPITTLELKDKLVEINSCQNEIEEFCKRLKMR